MRPRLASALADLGVGPGDRVGTLMGKSPDYLTTVHAIWRLGAAHVPLFTAFAPPAIALRLQASAAKVVVCDDSQRAKLDSGDDIPADARWSIVLAGPEAQREGDLSFQDLDRGRRRDLPRCGARRDGADRPHLHLRHHRDSEGRDPSTFRARHLHTYMEYGLDVHPDDVFWCAANPGWAYGLYPAVLGPIWPLGVRSLLLDAPFSRRSDLVGVLEIRRDELRRRPDCLPLAPPGLGAAPRSHVAVRVERRRAAHTGREQLGQLRRSALPSTTTTGRPSTGCSSTTTITPNWRSR